MNAGSILLYPQFLSNCVIQFHFLVLIVLLVTFKVSIKSSNLIFWAWAWLCFEFVGGSYGFGFLHSFIIAYMSATRVSPWSPFSIFSFYGWQQCFWIFLKVVNFGVGKCFLAELNNILYSYLAPAWNN